ncbi:hypothetical protein J7438_26235, partial [Thalassotalea sp. G20_0]|uniref:hypothetical protein n=1 Tax=Thalassotalea sp. G20_0 TaxID=2821093 RepID=UPI001ADB6967
AKYRELSSLTDDDLLKEMRGAKASYAGFFADVISRNPQCREKEGLLPEALKEAFTKIEEWVSL